MRHERLHPEARAALTLTGLYWAADALCSIFVSVYLWVNSHDFEVVFRHNIAIYLVTPVFIILAGWYAQARDRLHVYRAGIVLHAIYYGALLLLREQAAEYPGLLGALLGVTWGVFWAGANTITFDVTSKGNREYYFGTVAAVTGIFQMVAPVVGGFIIQYSGDRLTGYHRIFAVVILVYLASFVLTYRIPSDGEPRPYRIRRALLPGKDQRDWRLVMLASATLAGSFDIPKFLLPLLMFVETSSEVSAGGLASYQALIGIVLSYFVGRWVVPRTWKRYLFWGTVVLVAGGLVIAFKVTALTLIVFGFLRTASGSMINVPHLSLRYAIINRSVEEPGQRIEYVCAWEVPLAVGRVLMMGVMMGLWAYAHETGLRIALLILCLARVATYFVLVRTDTLREAAGLSPGPEPSLPSPSLPARS
jgi:YQGE family putative transporter